MVTWFMSDFAKLNWTSSGRESCKNKHIVATYPYKTALFEKLPAQNTYFGSPNLPNISIKSLSISLSEDNERDFLSPTTAPFVFFKHALQMYSTFQLFFFPFYGTAHAGNLLQRPLARLSNLHHGVKQIPGASITASFREASKRPRYCNSIRELKPKKSGVQTAP